MYGKGVAYTTDAHEAVDDPDGARARPIGCRLRGGINTIAVLVELARRGETPTAIVMSDPGSERRGTHEYREQVANPWLRARGWPEVTVVTRKGEAPYRPRAKDTPQGTLYEECIRIKALPSIAYGWKKCSQKYKAEPANWWTERQAWAQAAWARGERITRVIGYDADESSRARPEFLAGLEKKRFIPWYPLLEKGIDRDECIAIILRAGLPLPPKSSCRWCPSNTLAEWEELRSDPEGWAEAMALSTNAEIDSPDVVGLMRCNPNGKRTLHLHVFGDGACGTDEETMRDGMPCECAL
jgi:hypothetical protein